MFHIVLVCNVLLCVTKENDIEAAFQKFDINFLNCDFSVANSLNVTKSLGEFFFVMSSREACHNILI